MPAKLTVLLPAYLRQDCLAFAQCHRLAAKPRLRREHAWKVLGELRCFLAWQPEQRPIQQWGELCLSDLQAYQTARCGQRKAAMTINCTLARVLTLLQERSNQGQPVEPNVFRLQPLPRPDHLLRYSGESEALRLEAYVRNGCHTVRFPQRSLQRDIVIHNYCEIQSRARRASIFSFG